MAEGEATAAHGEDDPQESAVLVNGSAEAEKSAMDDEGAADDKASAEPAAATNGELERSHDGAGDMDNSDNESEEEDEESDEDDDVVVVFNEQDAPELHLQGGQNSMLKFQPAQRWNRISFPSGAGGGGGGSGSGPGGGTGGGGGLGGMTRSQAFVSMLPNATMNAGAQQKSVYDLEIGKLAEKPWRERGADISDYFNYGLNEATWKMYCERQVQIRLEASMLAKIKTVDGDKPEGAAFRSSVGEVGDARAALKGDRHAPVSPRPGGPAGEAAALSANPLRAAMPPSQPPPGALEPAMFFPPPPVGFPAMPPPIHRPGFASSQAVPPAVGAGVMDGGGRGGMQRPLEDASKRSSDDVVMSLTSGGNVVPVNAGNNAAADRDGGTGEGGSRAAHQWANSSGDAHAAGRKGDADSAGSENRASGGRTEDRGAPSSMSKAGDLQPLGPNGRVPQHTNDAAGNSVGGGGGGGGRASNMGGPGPPPANLGAPPFGMPFNPGGLPFPGALPFSPFGGAPPFFAAPPHHAGRGGPPPHAGGGPPPRGFNPMAFGAPPPHPGMLGGMLGGGPSGAAGAAVGGDVGMDAVGNSRRQDGDTNGVNGGRSRAYGRDGRSRERERGAPRSVGGDGSGSGGGMVAGGGSGGGGGGGGGVAAYPDDRRSRSSREDRRSENDRERDRSVKRDRSDRNGSMERERHSDRDRGERHDRGAGGGFSSHDYGANDRESRREERRRSRDDDRGSDRRRSSHDKAYDEDRSSKRSRR